MSKSIELKKQHEALLAQAKQFRAKAAAEVEEGEPLAPDAREQFEQMMGDAEKCRVKAQHAQDEERLEMAEAEIRQSAGRKVGRTAVVSTPHEVRQSDAKAAFRSWIFAETDVADQSPDTAVRAAHAGCNLNSKNLELRALSVATPSAGGYTVPILLSQEIDKALKYYANFRTFCRVVTTAGGGEWDYPQVTDVSNLATVKSEAASLTTNVDPTFSKVAFKSQKYHSDVVLVSYELMQDSDISIESLLADLLVERIARKQENDFLNGAGGGSAPNGMITASTVAVNLASGNAITFAKLKSLEHGLDIAYRRNARFVMHDSTWSVIEQLADSAGPSDLPSGIRGPCRRLEEIALRIPGRDQQCVPELLG